MMNVFCTYAYVEKVLYTTRDNTKPATLGKRDIHANPVDIYEFDGSGHVNRVLHPH